ncbi:T7SS effector LXG polymorphic toxin [Oceanobacillus locisalsi]|uniref:T7SS effector LXG polymorphic toxin n=1 Tax=Oceanobacillus locisalsi TaxID=546107 RepID=A0ABW3NM85_9BACI
MEQHLEAFRSGVDVSETAVIRSNYLQDVQEDVNELYEDLVTQDEIIHDTIQEVSDISSATPPSFSDIADYKTKVMKKLKEVDEDLASFTSTGDETDVQAIMSQIEAAMNRAQTSKGKARFADFEGASQGSDLGKLQAYSHEKKEERSAAVSRMDEENIDEMSMSEIKQAKDAELSDLEDGSGEILNMAYNDLRDGEMDKQTYVEVRDGLKNFDKEYKKGKEDFEVSEILMNYIGGKEKENDVNNKELEALKDLAAYGSSIIAGTTSSAAIAKAAQDKGLSVSEYTKNGKVTYRINASENALKELGVKPDHHAARDFKKQKKSGKPKTALNYPENRTGKQVWSKVGQDAVKNYPEIASYNDKASNWDKFKSVGKATYRGGKDSFTDLNPKNIRSNGTLRTAGKALGPVGVGLNYYGNYNDARAEVLTGAEAYTRATVDTTIDTAVSGGVQAGFTAAGTAFIPIPGVGTAIGAAAGIGMNWLLNQDFGSKGKSVMDRAKGAIHKIKGWFS